MMPLRLTLVPVRIVDSYSNTEISFEPCIASDLLVSRSTAVEEAVFANCNDESNADYRTKMRSLYLNLKGKENPSLREGVVSGSIAAKKLAVMSSAVCLLSMSTVMATEIDCYRKWRQRSADRRIKLCKRRIYSSLWVSGNNRQRQMHSNVADANRFVIERCR